MAITKLNSLAIPAGTVEPADISYPLTNFSSTGIDDNATATAITIKTHSGGTGPTIGIGNTTATAYSGTSALHIGDSSGEGELYLNGQYNTVLQHTVDGGGGAGVSAQSLQMLLNDGSGNVTLDWRIDNTRSSYNKVIEHYRHVSDGTQDYTRFQTNTTERMRIDGDGNVGIGTNTFNLSSFSSPGLAVGSITEGERGTIELGANITTATAYGILAFTNHSSTDTTNNKRVAQITATRSSGSNEQASLDFATNDGSTYTTRMRINPNGNMVMYGANITSSQNGFNPTTSGWATGAAFIGTSSYGGGLSFVDGSAGYTLYVDTAGTNFRIGQGSTSGGVTNRLTIDPNGRLLVGGTSTTSSFKTPIWVEGYKAIGFGQAGSGVGGSVGAKRLDSIGNLDYSSYFAYDCHWDHDNSYWVSHRDSLSAKLIMQAGYHSGGFQFLKYAGSASATFSDSNLTELARIDADGLKFNGDTAVANALDDYEEGTWDSRPSTSTSSVSLHSGLSITNSNGTYTKVGRLVTVCYYFEWSNTSTDTSAVYLVLPFTVKQYLWSGSGTEVSKPTFPSGRTYITVRPEQNNTYASFKACGSSATRIDMTGNLFFAISGGYALGSFSYFTDA